MRSDYLHLNWRARRIRRAVRGPLVRLRHIGIEPADVVIAEYPRSGSTWFATMVAAAVTSSETADVGRLIPGVGKHRNAPRILPGDSRLLRTHEPERALYGRALYLVRHPGDVAVSYHRWLQWVGWLPSQLSFKAFLKEFVTRGVDGYGRWTEHVQAWTRAPADGSLVVRYEDVLRDPASQLVRALRFVGLDPDEDQIITAIKIGDVRTMRQAQTAVAEEPRTSNRRQFIRTARSGAWREEFDDDDIRLLYRTAGEVMRQHGYRED